MKFQFQILQETRKNTLNAIQELSFKQLTTIPEGFNNNILWNFCHTILVQHLLCYKLSGLPFEISNELIERYSKGTKADNSIKESDFDFLKSIALSSIKDLENNYNKNVFKSFKTYPTSYNVVLNSIEEAIAFNNVHEGLHYGYILALKKAL